MKRLIVLVIMATFLIAACATPTPEIIVVTATSEPTVEPTATPKPPVDIQITECGYGEFGQITMAGTITNNTSEDIRFLYVAVALVKNSQVIRSDEVVLVCPGKNLGILHGLDYYSGKQFASGETRLWSVGYILTKLTQPFECEASITDAR